MNVLEKAFPFSRYRWAVVIGAGMRWSRYRIDTNEYFKEIDGVTALRPAPEGVTLKASKLNITSLTIPLLLEWQPKKRSSEFFLSAGVVGVIKTCSSSKIVYNDASGKKHKEKMDSGMNIRPVTMDFLFQAGWDWIGLYAKYSPIDLFENGKGRRCIRFLSACSCICRSLRFYGKRMYDMPDLVNQGSASFSFLLA